MAPVLLQLLKAYSTECDSQCGWVFKRGQEQFDQLSEMIQGPLHKPAIAWTDQGLANGPAGAQPQDHLFFWHCIQ